ncbi:MAG: hypothetical protein JRN06_07450 [Nitrososphaerota archaeon]|nr:hypothetical protein [Nitrososphaerota archaeon]MDG7024383.1 hypothetical protein [Nitrososphaerota archaeon]
MVCLDTSELVAIIRKDQAALDSLEAEARRGGEVSTTPVNLCELYAGTQGARDLVKEQSKMDVLRAVGQRPGRGRQTPRVLHVWGEALANPRTEGARR